MLTLLAMTLIVSSPDADNNSYATDDGYLYQCGERKKGNRTIKFLKQFEPHLEISEEEPEGEYSGHFSWYLTWKMICDHKPNVN